jgi:hypothetical protein
MNEVTVRELGGEIWSELGCRSQEAGDKLAGLHWQKTEAITDLIMAILARHAGKCIKNDEDIPITPLPLRQHKV